MKRIIMSNLFFTLLLLPGTAVASYTVVGDVPFISEDYVVQGMGALCEGGQNCGATPDRLYVSFYQRYENAPSVIAEYMPTEPMLMTRCFLLTGELSHSHVGGAAVFRDFLYVSANNMVEKYKLPISYVPIGAAWFRTPKLGPMAPPYSTSACTPIEALQSWRVKASSFVSFVQLATPHLMTGLYCSHEDDFNDESEGGYPCKYPTGLLGEPYLYLYELSESGDILRRPDRPANSPHCVDWDGQDLTSNDRCEDWVLKHALPEKAQGGAINPASLVVSVVKNNSGAANALIWTYNFTSCEDYCSTPPILSALAMPRGMEDVVWTNGYLWSGNESGSFNWSNDDPYFYRFPEPSW